MTDTEPTLDFTRQDSTRSKIIQIPFAGFYESIFTQSLDIVEEREAEYYEQRQKKGWNPGAPMA
jgi:hypothetical protein